MDSLGSSFNLFKFHLILLSILLTVSLPLSARTDRCESLFIKSDLVSHLEVPISTRDTHKIHKPTIRFVGKISTPIGELYEIERTGKTWGSDYRSSGADPQGSPQWPILLFGYKAAAKLGFKILNRQNDRMTIPSAEYLNHRIREANLHLDVADKILLTFTRVNGVISNQEFVAMYLRDQLPLVDPQVNITSASHDLATHLMSILLPTEILRASQASMPKFLELNTEVRRHTAETSEAEMAARFEDFVFKGLARRIDEGTATIALGEIAKINRERGGKASRDYGSVSPIIVATLTLIGDAKLHLGFTKEKDLASAQEIASRLSVLQTFDRHVYTTGNYLHQLTADKEDEAVMDWIWDSRIFPNVYKVFIDEWRREAPSIAQAYSLPSLGQLDQIALRKRRNFISVLEAVP